MLILPSAFSLWMHMYTFYVIFENNLHASSLYPSTQYLLQLLHKLQCLYHIQEFLYCQEYHLNHTIYSLFQLSPSKCLFIRINDIIKTDDYNRLSPRHHGMNLSIVAYYLMMILNYFPWRLQKYVSMTFYKESFLLLNLPILFFAILMDSLSSSAGHFPQSSYKHHYLELVFSIVINNQTINLHQSQLKYTSQPF